MKYLKTLEKFKDEPICIGDLVILDINIARGFFNRDEETFYSTNIGEVIKKNDSNHRLTIKYISGEEKEIYETLLRKVTPEEFKEYQTKNTELKYNL